MLVTHADRLEFGSFGGFAGAYTEFKVVPDGQVWKQSRHNGTLIPIASIDKAVLSQFTGIMKDFEDKKYAVNNPGNMTYFIRLIKKGQEPYELIWGGGEKVDHRLKSVYKTLVKLCKEENPVR